MESIRIYIELKFALRRGARELCQTLPQIQFRLGFLTPVQPMINTVKPSKAHLQLDRIVLSSTHPSYNPTNMNFKSSFEVGSYNLKVEHFKGDYGNLSCCNWSVKLRFCG